MNHVLKSVIFFSLLHTTNLFAQGQPQAEPCIQSTDLEQLSEDFDQFRQFLSNKSEYCEGDIGKEWLMVANSMVALHNMEPNEPETDDKDALTFKAINENSWWDYFTNRADQIVVESNCPPNVVAYVQPLFGMGRIHICETFFKINVYSRASTMMHEVRHFDGHRHVTCTQGNEQGVRGACDGEITSQGSYAISVQTLVGMARSEQTEGKDQAALEGEAIYMAFNKFNRVPQVKLEKSIYLSNTVGETYKWILGQGADLVEVLNEPARVLSSGNDLTIYPLDPSVDAYRMDQKFSARADNPGLYAVHYNEFSPSERSEFSSISYSGTGGLLRNNALTTFCDFEAGKLSTLPLDDKGTFTALIALSKDETDLAKESYLVSDAGELFRYKCAESPKGEVAFSQSELTIASGSRKIGSSFGMDGHQYALMKNGILKEMVVSGTEIEAQNIDMPLENSNWVSATPMSRSKLF